MGMSLPVDESDTRCNHDWYETSGMNDQERAAKALRSRAESAVLSSPARAPDSVDSLLPVEMLRVLHELRVHQVELEMQNEKLRQTQQEIEASHARYFHLYEFAPVGYCTLSEQGVILQANLHLRSMLGMSQETLLRRPLSQFIHPEDANEYELYRRLFSDADPLPAMVLRLLCASAPPIWASIKSAAGQDSKGSSERLMAISDITDLKLHEVRLQKFNLALETEVLASISQLKRMYTRLLLAQENERKRIALDLHDSLGQTLSAIKLIGGHRLASLHSHRSRAEKVFASALLKDLAGAIEEVRRISMNLRPSMLDDLGLLATITWLIAHFKAANPSIHVTEQIELEEEVIPEVLKITLFRILQEASHNIEKHSQATGVTFTLALVGGHLTLSVFDNGQGCDPRSVGQSNSHGGLGLASMQERTELSGGTFELRSSPEGGTLVVACWHLPIET